jgi:hypothetical protein
MKTVRIVAATAAISFATGAGMMWAQQQTAASHREEQFENEYMKVWKTTVMPKAPLQLHRHDHGRALISLNGGVLKVEDKDRKVLDTYNLTAGKAMWSAHGLYARSASISA